MQGSSAFQFGRAAYQGRAAVAAPAGRRRAGRTSASGCAARATRTRTRCATGSRRRWKGTTRPRPRASRAERAGRGATADLPAGAEDRARASGRGPARIHRHGRLAGAGTDPGSRAGVRRRDRIGVLRGGRTASTPDDPTGLFIYGEGKARAIEELARREGIDLAASYAYSDSASDLPMLRARRATQSRSTPTGSCSGGARAGLGGAPLRPARAAAEGGDRRGGRRGRRRHRQCRAGVTRTATALGPAACRRCARGAGGRTCDFVSCWSQACNRSLQLSLVREGCREPDAVDPAPRRMGHTRNVGRRLRIDPSARICA